MQDIGSRRMSECRRFSYLLTAVVSVAKGRVGVGAGVGAVVARAVVSGAVVRVLGRSHGDQSQDEEDLKHGTC